MKSIENKNIIFIRLYPGEELISKILKACKKYKVKTAIVLSGIGQLKEIEIGYFKNKGNYLPNKFKKALELLSLSGNIIINEKDIDVHLHVTLGDEDKKCLGGHLIKGVVSVTAEIFLIKTDLKLERVLDSETGLKGLNIK